MRIMEKREKEQEAPEFDINYRGFNAKAWYLKNTETTKGAALIEISHKGEIIRSFIFPAYKIWNIAAHFRDIVDGELENSDKGYRIATRTGL